MGNKVNANGFRIGVNKNWITKWIAPNAKVSVKWLLEDEKIRNYLIENFDKARIVETIIERDYLGNSIKVIPSVCTPTLITEEDKKVIIDKIQRFVGRGVAVELAISTFANPNWSARILAKEIATAIENRVSFRTAQKAAIRKSMAEKVVGIKTKVSGRLGGVDMARIEGYSEGVVPLSTIRADIDYAHEYSHTAKGVIGVSVWINRGEIFAKGMNSRIAIPQHNFNKNNNKRGGGKR